MDWFKFFEEKEADLWMLDEIESLLMGANLSPKELESISLNQNKEEAEETIKYLQANQVCKIHAGMPYGERYITYKLKTEI